MVDYYQRKLLVMFIGSSTDRVVIKYQSVLFFSLYTLAFIYMTINRNWYGLASIFQAALFVLIFFSYIYNVRRVKNTIYFWTLIIFLPLYVFYHGQYVLNVITFYVIFEICLYLNRNSFYRGLAWYAVFVSLASILVYVFFHGGGLYNYLEFSNQVIPNATRLLGLDGSPVGLSLVAVFGMLASFQLRGIIFRLLIPTFLFCVVIYTGSRTVMLALFMSLILASQKRLFYVLSLVIVTIMPFLMTYIYMSSTENSFILYYIEKITSFRVVNWVNALCYFYEGGVFDKIFGFGHLPILKSPYIFESLFDGYYQYKFVTYTESGLLRILVNYGIIFFVVFFLTVYFLAWKMNAYKDRVVVMVVFFSAFLYDPVFSIQYFFIILMMYLALTPTRNYNESL